MTKPKAPPEETQLHDTALRLLARREHSALELRHKLLARGYQDAAIDAELNTLITDNLLNEQRYAEVYAHHRLDKGYGPLRIDRELRERGVEASSIGDVLAPMEDLWMEHLQRLQARRFGELPRDNADKLRQMRFLRQRGFTLEQINRLFKDRS